MTITQNGALKRDDNDQAVMGGTSSSDNATIVNASFDPVTRRLLTDSAGGGSGTVTSVSVVTANGFAGSVANATTTPAITLSTTITGVLKGDGTAISAASSSTDYAALAFKTISVSGQSDVVADSPIDTLTLVGSGITITTNASTDTITFTSAAASLVVGTTTITSGTTTRILYDNAGLLGEYTLTGTGTVVAMQTSPTFVTDITTPVIKLSATSNQAVFQSAGVTGTLTWTPTSTNKTITFPDRSLTVDNITTATTTNGTGFIKGNGSVVSFDNSTYITGLVVGTTTIGSGTTTRILYDNEGVLGEYTLTGTGTVVAMATAPTFVTSITTPTVLATANDSGALGASGTAFADLFLASGGVINWAAADVTITHATNNLLFAGASSGYTFDAKVYPTSDDGAALGDTTHNFSDLFLASGAVINYANSNVVLTQSSGILTMGTGEMRITSPGTNSASVVTCAGGQTLSSKTISAATLSGTQQLAENASIALDAAGSADGKFSGITIAGTAGTTLAFGDLIYLAVADSRWELTDADSAATSYGVMLGMCVLAAAADGDPTIVLLQGQIRADANFPTLTVGAAVYLGESAGKIQVAIPTGADNTVRVVGFALTADEIYFNPSQDSSSTVA